MPKLGTKWVNWFYELFPPRFRENDSYYDSAGEGLFKRFLSIFGDYVYATEEDWENYVQNTRDLDECLDIFLPVIAKDLGSPPNPLNNEIGLRRLLHYIVSIYKIKGTLESLQIMLEILGYTVQIEVLYPEESTWDFKDETTANENPLIWDEFNWDDICQSCIHYNILISSNEDDIFNGEYNDITIDDLSSLVDIIEWLAPASSQLDLIIPNISYCEEINLDTDEEVIISCEEFEFYDGVNWDEFNWDDSTPCGESTYYSGLGAFSNAFNTGFNT